MCAGRWGQDGSCKRAVFEALVGQQGAAWARCTAGPAEMGASCQRTAAAQLHSRRHGHVSNAARAACTGSPCNSPPQPALAFLNVVTHTPTSTAAISMGRCCVRWGTARCHGCADGLCGDGALRLPAPPTKCRLPTCTRGAALLDRLPAGGSMGGCVGGGLARGAPCGVVRAAHLQGQHLWQRDRRGQAARLADL